MAFAVFRPHAPEHALPTPEYYQNMWAPPKPLPQPQIYAQDPSPKQMVSCVEDPHTPTNISPNEQIMLYKKGPVAKTLYTPAVLRPTENRRPRHTFPGSSRNSPSPLTPPGSLQNSLNIESPEKNAQGVLSRRNTDNSVEGVTMFEAEMLARDTNEFGYGKVTALPTKIHWKPDSETTVCDDLSCDRRFTYFNRKHHCRRCGSIFCDAHSSNLIPLNQDAEFHPNGNRVRGCDSCWRNYSEWEVRRVDEQKFRERVRNGVETEVPPSPASITSPVSAKGVGGDGLNKHGWITPPGTAGFNERVPAQVASSVPGDWCWSSF